MTGQKLCEAALIGDAAKVSTLLSAQGARSFINYQDAHGATPLMYAAGDGHAAVTKQLLKARCNVDPQAENGAHQQQGPFSRISPFQKRPTTSRSGWAAEGMVSLSMSAGGGDACCRETARARRFAGRRISGAIYDRSDAYRGGGAVARAAHQHRAADGIEQGRHGALLSLLLDEGW
jgi:hypothetical protein